MSELKDRISNTEMVQEPEERFSASTHSRMTASTHKDLDIWKLGMDLVEMTYTATRTFPKEELYGLTSQLRRSAVSIPSNIAEGAARKGNQEYLQFLYVSLGSLSELETQFLIALRLQYLQEENEVFQLIEVLRRKLLNFIKYQKSKK